MLKIRRSPVLEAPGILVADADRKAGGRLAAYLRGQGFRASHTASGRGALARARAGGVAVAIVDVALGDMPGRALASRLKEIGPAIRILMTSADHSPKVEIAARRVGILYYAHKPLDYRMLGSIVAKAMGNHERAGREKIPPDRRRRGRARAMAGRR